MKDRIKDIQEILGVTPDGLWGPKSRQALDLLVRSAAEIEHHVKATSFADPRDIERFKQCKAQGKSDQECFKVGDNGIGAWGDDTTVPFPICALPPDDMIERWGSIDAAKYKPVEVHANGKEPITCILKERMPWRSHIDNGAGIDLNPAACLALGFTPPVYESVVWRWA